MAIGRRLADELGDLGLDTRRCLVERDAGHDLVERRSHDLDQFRAEAWHYAPPTTTTDPSICPVGASPATHNAASDGCRKREAKQKGRWRGSNHRPCLRLAAR